MGRGCKVNSESYLSDGARLHYLDSGSGVPVIFLHPTPLDNFYWRPLIDRLGSVRANRPHGDFGAVVFRPKQIVQSEKTMVEGYGPLLQEIVKFFQTGVAPVAPEETLEIIAFMDAAQRSKAAGGQPMQLR